MTTKSRKSKDDDTPKTTKRKTTSKAKVPRASKSKTKEPRKGKTRSQPATQAIITVPCVDEGAKQDARSRPTDLPGDLPSVTVKDEAEAVFYFQRIDVRLAEAWKRDVVMHEGPITIRRCFASRFESTHYAYVDQRLFWYLKRDPADPLGARWDGYLKNAHDVPRGAVVVVVGRDLIAKKCTSELSP